MGNFHDDIERYKRGELSSAEMHKLERQALEDPFLADALEGIDPVSAHDLSMDLGLLRDQLNRRTRQDRKTVTMTTWVMRIAAAATILLAGTYLLTTLNSDNDKERGDLAMNKSETPSPQVTDSIAPLLEDQDVTKDVSAEAPTPAAVAVEEKKFSDEEKKVTSEISHHDDKPTPQDEDLIDKEPDLPIASQPNAEVAGVETDKAKASDDIIELEAEPAVSARQTDERTKSLKSKTASAAADIADRKIVRGQVIDSEDGKGLPGVNVTIAGTNTGTVTDGEGNYEIVLNDVSDGLLFSFIGFENREVIPGSSNKLDVTLQPDYAQLSEVVVVGYGVAKDTLDGYPILEMAAPKGGRKAYKQYLVSELRYPEQALENNVEGKVTIQFTVETSGTLSEFKVLKGIGHGCEEEVIRLIKEGPKWTASRRNTKTVRDRVRVRVKFALPKK
jgi:TonB family protein